MDLADLREEDVALVGQVLRAAAYGPFFPDWEFSALFGLDRAELRAIADSWPLIVVADEEAVRVVTQSLNNLLDYPHGERLARSEWISGDNEDLYELLRKMR